jgi:ABC-type Mn2+/Zn2+ transport system permease subunit/Mn-dependent DtxR family transcriptional regulator
VTAVALLGPLLEPLLEYGFLRAGLAAAVVVGLSSAVLSCLLVVRHQALLGDAISHAVLLGVAVGYLVAGSAGILGGALIVAVASALLITYLERHSPVKLDAVMGIVFTATFALGLAVISVTRPTGIDLNHILFGNVLGVSAGDLALTVVSGALVVGVVLALFRPFQLWSFDPVAARALGLRTDLLQYVFTALLSATIVASLQAVGLILVVAMLVTPGATALLLTSRLSTMMAVSAAVGLLSAVGGLYGSYYVDVASGPAIVLVASACFALAFLGAPRRGVLARLLASRRAARRTLDEDLLKALFDPEEPPALAVPALAERVGAGRERVAGRVRALTRRRLVTTDGDRVELTAAGRDQALRMVRAHRLLESYAHRAEGVPLHELHDVAERLEHEVSPGDLSDMDRLLGGPSHDPHGHPIPSAAGELARMAGRPLAQRPLGEEGIVAMVADDRGDLLEAMVDMGILPQRQVAVVARGDGAYRVRVGDREVAVPGEVAERVYVIPA